MISYEKNKVFQKNAQQKGKCCMYGFTNATGKLSSRIRQLINNLRLKFEKYDKDKTHEFVKSETH